MDYIEGFVVVVFINSKDDYICYVREVVKIFKEYGVIKLVECWGDDVFIGEKMLFFQVV